MTTPPPTYSSTGRSPPLDAVFTLNHVNSLVIMFIRSPSDKLLEQITEALSAYAGYQQSVPPVTVETGKLKGVFVLSAEAQRSNRIEQMIADPFGNSYKIEFLI